MLQAIESSQKWISPKFPESSLFIPYLYYYYFNSSSARTIFILLKLVWTCLWQSWTGKYTRQGLQTFYQYPFRKIIHFNCPLKLCNNFISFREPIYFSFFIEIFEITDNNLKIYRSSWNFEVDLIYLWKYTKCLKF